jgi:hypothetical protein
MPNQKHTILDYDLESVQIFMNRLQILLKYHSGARFDMSLKTEQEKEGQNAIHSIVLRLLLDSKPISKISLEIGYEQDVYMHSFTEKEYEGRKCNSFLRAVIICVVFLLRSNTGQRFTIIGSNPSTWVSIWILYSKFGFKADEHEYGEFWNILSTSYDMQNRQTVLKALKGYPKQNPYPCLFLDLVDLPFEKYCTLCETLLEDMIKRGLKN